MMVLFARLRYYYFAFVACLPAGVALFNALFFIEHSSISHFMFQSFITFKVMPLA